MKILNLTSLDNIRKKFISEVNDESGLASYLFGYEKENPSYEYLTDVIFEGKRSKKNVAHETVYTSNLACAKSFFSEKLQKMTNDELEEIFSKIAYYFAFNTYEISSDIDVFVTFETMNNRGRPLSSLELLKNRLIYLSTLFEEAEKEEHKENKNIMRVEINECWKKIYHLLGKGKHNLLKDDEFLHTHYFIYFYDEEFYPDRHSTEDFYRDFLLEHYFVPEKIVTKELTEKHVFDYINSLKDCIEYWHNISNPDFSTYKKDIREYLKKINYLLLQPSFLTHFYSHDVRNKALLLMCLKKAKNEQEIFKFLKDYEKYLFLATFVPPRYNSFVEAIIKFNKSLRKDIPSLKSGNLTVSDVTTKIEKLNKEILTSDETSKAILDHYSREGFYRSPFIKYFLSEYETSLMSQSGSGTEKLDRDKVFKEHHYSIEHIYPEQAHDKYWTDRFKHFNQHHKDSLRNSLGNLLLVSKEKNNKLGNKSFPDKNGRNPYSPASYSNGSYSEHEVSTNSEWSANQIRDRGIKLAGFLKKRWGIKIGTNRADTIKFLGLQNISFIPPAKVNSPKHTKE